MAGIDQANARLEAKLVFPLGGRLDRPSSQKRPGGKVVRTHTQSSIPVFFLKYGYFQRSDSRLARLTRPRLAGWIL